MRSWGHEKENDRSRSKDQNLPTERPAERGFLPDGLSDGAGDDPAQRGFEGQSSSAAGPQCPAFRAILLTVLEQVVADGAEGKCCPTLCAAWV
jgi:hypothetical protein